MALNKKYYWLKLKSDFFKQKEIKKLRKVAGGDTYTIIYLKVQLLSLANSGTLVFEGIEDTLAEELALELDEDETNVELTLNYMFKHGLIVEGPPDEFILTETKELIGKETDSTIRSRRSRENKKMLQCNNNATKCNTEIEIEIEKQIEIEKEKDSSSSREEEESDERVCEIMRFCQKLNFKLKKLDAIDFVNLYGIQKVKQALITVGHTEAIIKNPAAYLAAVLKDMSRDKKVEININKNDKNSNFNNFKQREYSPEETEEILGWWDDDEGEQNE